MLGVGRHCGSPGLGDLPIALEARQTCRISPGPAGLRRVGVGADRGVLVVELQPLVLSQMFDVADEQAAPAVRIRRIDRSVVDRLDPEPHRVFGFALGGGQIFPGSFQSAIETGGKSARWRTWLAGVTAQATVWIAERPCRSSSGSPISICPSGASPTVRKTMHPDGWPPSRGESSASGGWPGHGNLLALCGGGHRFVAGRRLWLKPNVNSLHRLYRDRISKAFLFNPDEREDDGRITGARDLKALDAFPLPTFRWRRALSSHQCDAEHSGRGFRQPARPRCRFLPGLGPPCRQHRHRLRADGKGGGRRPISISARRSRSPAPQHPPKWDPSPSVC